MYLSNRGCLTPQVFQRNGYSLSATVPSLPGNVLPHFPGQPSSCPPLSSLVCTLLHPCTILSVPLAGDVAGAPMAPTPLPPSALSSLLPSWMMEGPGSPLPTLTHVRTSTSGPAPLPVRLRLADPHLTPLHCGPTQKPTPKKSKRTKTSSLCVNRTAGSLIPGESLAASFFPSIS